MSECVRIHGSFADVDAEAADRQADGRSYERLAQSSRIVCVDDPRDAAKVSLWGFQPAHLERRLGHTVTLGDLAKLSPEQVAHVARLYSEKLRETYGWTPSNLVIVAEQRWFHLWRGRKYRKNLAAILMHMGQYRKFVVFRTRFISRWLPYRAIEDNATIIFELEPADLDPDALAKFRGRFDKLDMRRRYCVSVEHLPFDGHFYFAKKCELSVVMTGERA